MNGMDKTERPSRTDVYGHIDFTIDPGYDAPSWLRITDPHFNTRGFYDGFWYEAREARAKKKPTGIPEDKLPLINTMYYGFHWKPHKIASALHLNEDALIKELAYEDHKRYSIH